MLIFYRIVRSNKIIDTKCLLFYFKHSKCLNIEQIAKEGNVLVG